MIKNYNFGELLNNLIAEREREKQKFIDKLVNQRVNQDNGQGNEIDLGPIQNVFSLNLREGLLSYQQYFDAMQTEKKELK